ncbi:hypothetical protein [Streptomyces sp. NPDC045470]|uniref:hypothetical protein n=1 Tax=unclassified Streptomyces TaxID=2593676 RepID=UPI0033D5FAA1
MGAGAPPGERERIAFGAQARAGLLALGELLAREVLDGITAEIGTGPPGGTSIERPLGGRPWDRAVFVAGWATVRYRTVGRH